MKYKRILVSIGAEKIEECVNFYWTLLGYPPRVYQVSIYAEFDLNGLILGIFKPRAGEEKTFSNSSPGNSGLSICLEVENLENALIQLTQLGYPTPNPIHSSSTLREVYAYDPSGNRLILYQYL